MTQLQSSLIFFYRDHGVFGCDDTVKDLELVEINTNVQGLVCSIKFWNEVWCFCAVWIALPIIHIMCVVILKSHACK